MPAYNSRERYKSAPVKHGEHAVRLFLRTDGGEVWACKVCGMWHYTDRTGKEYTCPTIAESQKLAAAHDSQEIPQSQEQEKAMKLTNYRYQVLYHPLPTLEEAQRGIQPDTIQVVPPTDALVKDDAHARLLAARAVPKEYEDKAAQLEIVTKSGL